MLARQVAAIVPSAPAATLAAGGERELVGAYLAGGAVLLLHTRPSLLDETRRNIGHFAHASLAEEWTVEREANGWAVKEWGDDLSASTSTDTRRLHPVERAVTAELADYWDVEKQPRNRTKSWGDDFAADLETDTTRRREQGSSSTATLAGLWGREIELRDRAKIWGDDFAADSATETSRRQEQESTGTAALAGVWGREIELRDRAKGWGDSLAATSGRELGDSRILASASAAGLTGQWSRERQARNQTKSWGDNLAATSTSDPAESERHLTRQAVASLAEGWSRTRQARSQTKSWGDNLAATGASDSVESERHLTRQAVASLAENWSRERQSRGRTKSWGEGLTATSGSTLHEVTSIGRSSSASLAENWGRTRVANVPGVPRNLAAQLIPGERRVRLTWQAPTGGGTVSGYQVQWFDPSAASWFSAGSTSSLTLDHRPPVHVANLSVQYRVAAYNGGGTGSYTPGVWVGLDGPPGPPAVLNAEWNALICEVDLWWPPADFALYYELRRFGVLIASPNGTFWSDSGAMAVTNYNYSVRSINEWGQSADRTTNITTGTCDGPD